MVNQKTKAVKEFIRHHFAWPGGYEMYAVCNDGSALCHKCTKENAKLILRATRSQDRSGWCVDAVDINYDIDDLCCDHCCNQIAFS